MNRILTAGRLAGLVLLLACGLGCNRGSAAKPAVSLAGVRVGMTRPAFLALNLPTQMAEGSGPTVRYSEVYLMEDGSHLATLWNNLKSPPRLLWFRLYQ